MPSHPIKHLLDQKVASHPIHDINLAAFSKLVKKRKTILLTQKLVLWVHRRWQFLEFLKLVNLPTVCTKVIEMSQKKFAHSKVGSVGS